MNTSSATSHLLRRLEPDEAVRLLARMPGAQRHGVLVSGIPRRGPVRDAIVRWVAADGEPADQQAALRGGGSEDPRRDFVAALVDARDPDVRAAVYLHRAADPVLRRRILVDGPYADTVPDRIRDVLAATRSRHRLGPALDAADPALAAMAARRVHGPRWRPVPRDPAGLFAWLHVPFPGRNDAERGRGVPERLGPRARRVRARLAVAALECWTDADWAAFVALNAERPLDPVTASRVAGHAACPAAAALELLRHVPDHAFRDVLAHVVTAGTVTAEDLRLRVVPAGPVLRVLGTRSHPEPASSAPAWTEARERLTQDVRDRLGADSARWASLLALLQGDFAGTATELLDAAAHQRLVPDPDTEPRPGTSPWNFLLALADPRHTAAIIAGVVEATAASHPAASARRLVAGELLKCLSLRELSDAATDAFLALADPAQLVALATRVHQRPDLIDRLYAFDLPGVNLELLRNRLPARLRRRILSGTSHATGRPGSLALHPAITDDQASGRIWGITDKDYIHTDHVGRIAKMLDTGPQLCATYQAACGRRLVELGRFDLVVEFARRTDRTRGAIPLPGVAEALRGPVANGDPQAAHRALRTLADRVFLRNIALGAGNEILCHLAAEAVVDWAAVAEQLRREPVPPGVAAVLAGADGLPDDLALMLMRADPGGCAGALAGRSPELARLALERAKPTRSSPPQAGIYRDPWHEVCVRSGHFTVAELVERTRPAADVPALFDNRPDLRLRADAAIRELMDRHGPLSDDALLFVQTVLADFPGTLPELFATAVAATSAQVPQI